MTNSHKRLIVSTHLRVWFIFFLHSVLDTKVSAETFRKNTNHTLAILDDFIFLAFYNACDGETQKLKNSKGHSVYILTLGLRCTRQRPHASAEAFIKYILCVFFERYSPPRKGVGKMSSELTKRTVGLPEAVQKYCEGEVC